MAASRTKCERHVALLLALVLGGCMTNAASPEYPSGLASTPAPHEATVTVRYQVANIERATAFYTERLDFRTSERYGSVFAAVVRGGLRLILSGPGSSGSRPMPNGRRQEPGGWNRIVIYVDDLPALIQSLRSAGVPFRNDIEVGPGGSQILIEDPDGNPIELHQPPAWESRPNR